MANSTSNWLPFLLAQFYFQTKQAYSFSTSYEITKLNVCTTVHNHSATILK